MIVKVRVPTSPIFRAPPNCALLSQTNIVTRSSLDMRCPVDHDLFAATVVGDVVSTRSRQVIACAQTHVKSLVLRCATRQASARHLGAMHDAYVRQHALHSPPQHSSAVHSSAAHVVVSMNAEVPSAQAVSYKAHVTTRRTRPPGR